MKTNLARALSVFLLHGCALPPPNDLPSIPSVPTAQGGSSQPQQAAATGCASSQECKGGRVCHQGACIPPVDPAASNHIQGGGAELASLKKLVQSKTCVAAPGVDDVLSKAASNKVNAAELTARMAQPDGAYPELIGDWLLTARKYLHNCGMDERPAAFAKAADTLAAIVSEDNVEDAVRRVDCGGMSIINDARMWPYEQRFSREIVARRFRDAEVTRRVWSETITTFSTECAKRLNMRDRIAARTQLDNLEHIIGLDDSLLIDLRSRLLMAMEKGDANAVATLSSAISQREGALDQRHTNDQVKQLDIRYRIAEKQRLAAEAQLGEAKRLKAAQIGADVIASAEGANQAAQGAVQTARAAINTAKDIENTVSLARSVFGF